MARRRYQQGRLFPRAKNPPRWIGRWREDILQEDGSVERVERSIALGTKTDLPTERGRFERRQLWQSNEPNVAPLVADRRETHVLVLSIDRRAVA
jgi:hypothetical protein